MAAAQRNRVFIIGNVYLVRAVEPWFNVFYKINVNYITPVRTDKVFRQQPFKVLESIDREANCFLQKPFTMRELSLAVYEILKSKIYSQIQEPPVLNHLKYPDPFPE